MSLGNEPVDVRSAARFLGVFIDCEFRFRDHIKNLSKKLSSACFAVRAARNALGSGVARDVYFALFDSHLSYGIPFWGISSQYLLNILVVL